MRTAFIVPACNEEKGLLPRDRTAQIDVDDSITYGAFEIGKKCVKGKMDLSGHDANRRLIYIGGN